MGVVSRWAVFTGLLIATGAIVFDLWILRGSHPARDDPEGEPAPAGYSPAGAAARLATLGAILLAVGAIGRLAAELAIFRDPFEPVGAELRLLLAVTTFGKAWTAQFGLALLALAAFVWTGRTTPAGGGRTAPWLSAGAVTLALSFTPAFSGHALGSQDWTALAITSDGLHVIAGGAWLGTLGVIAWAADGARRSGSPIPRAQLIDWVTRFSPVALSCAAVLGVSGVFAAWLHIDVIPSLWRSAYGQRLLLKLGVVSLVLGFGVFNWKKSRGRIALSGDPARLPGSVAAELAAALAILLVTAVLVTTAPPGE